MCFFWRVWFPKTINIFCSAMFITVGINDIENFTSIFKRIWTKIHKEVCCISSRLNRYRSIVKDICKKSFCRRIYFLNLSEITFWYNTIKKRNLFDSDNTIICNNEHIKLMVKPLCKDKQKKSHPKKDKEQVCEEV